MEHCQLMHLREAISKPAAHRWEFWHEAHALSNVWTPIDNFGQGVYESGAQQSTTRTNKLEEL